MRVRSLGAVMAERVREHGNDATPSTAEALAERAGVSTEGWLRARSLHDAEAASNWCEPYFEECDWQRYYLDRVTCGDGEACEHIHGDARA